MPFNIGEIEGQLDTLLSFRSLWSTASVDSRLVGAANGGRGWTQAGDDGRLNFRRGDSFSRRFEGFHDLELRYRDLGLFLQGRYWYDFEQKDHSQPHKPITDSGRPVGAQASGAEWLDAFVYRHHSLGEQHGTLRLGRQTVRWGESRFIGGGIDAINPRDIEALLPPTAELRQAARPAALVYLSQSLTSTLGLDLFYQLDWQPDLLPNCGTFFSQADGLAPACLDHDVSANLVGHRQSFGAGAGEGIRLRRTADHRARDNGQFGIALNGFGKRFDYGLYALHYHSRSGMFGTRTAGSEAFADASLTELAGLGDYTRRFPEDIRLYGLSVSTLLPAGTRWAAELSFRPNAPVQVSPAELVRRLGDPDYAGQVSKGYERKDVTQLITSLSHGVERVAGLDQLDLTAEVGYVQVGGLGGENHGRHPVFGLGGSGGFVTRQAWGYRLRAQALVRNVLPRVDLRPAAGLAHDVRGYAPGGVFNEGAKAASLALELRYLDTYSLAAEYVAFFGGRYNTLGDRDYLGVNLSARF